MHSQLLQNNVNSNDKNKIILNKEFRNTLNHLYIAINPKHFSLTKRHSFMQITNSLIQDRVPNLIYISYSKQLRTAKSADINPNNITFSYDVLEKNETFLELLGSTGKVLVSEMFLEKQILQEVSP